MPQVVTGQAPTAPGPETDAATARPAAATSEGTNGFLPAPSLGADFRERLRLLHGPERSLGHAGGRWTLTVYANEGGQAAYGGEPASRGALIVAAHTGSDGAGPILMMQKQGPGYDTEHGDWYYGVLAPDRRTLRDGKLDDCIDCHASAKRDYVFATPPPRY